LLRAHNFLARKSSLAGLAGMNHRPRNRLRSAALTYLLLGGCGNGLTTTLEVATGDAGIDSDADNPPTLGSYGRPCDVISNSQRYHASFSPTGDMVALTAGGPGHIELHATSDGHLVTGFDAHFGQVTALAFSPKDSVLATAGIDGAMKLWRDGVEVAQQQIFTSAVATLMWSHDGKSLALVSAGGPLALLHVDGNALAEGWSLDGQFGAERPFFSPDDTVLIANDGTANIFQRLLRVADGAPAAGPMLANSAYVVAQSPDGSLIAYIDNFVQHVAIERLSWQGEASTDTLLWQRGFPNRKGAVEFTADSKYVAIWSIDENAQVSLYDVENGNVVGTLPWTGNATDSLSFSSDGRWALVLDYEFSGGAVRLVDLGSGNSISIARQPGTLDAIRSPVSVSADSTVMASPTWFSSAANDSGLTIWNLGTRQRVAQIPWIYNYPTAVPGLSARGDLVCGLEDIYSPGNDSSYTIGLRFDSVVDPTLIAKAPANPSSYAVALANDSRTLAVAYWTSPSEWRLSLLDRLTSVTKADFPIGARPTANLFFSPDGTQIAVLHTQMFGSSGKDFSVWRVSDGQMLFEASYHTAAPRGLAFSPDGAKLVLIGDGGTDFAGIEVYDARRWTWLRTLGRSYNPRASVRFSPDGQYLVVPHADGIRVWRTLDWQRYESFAGTDFGDAVFLPQDQGLLDVATGIIWCPF
jgi:WD40 repeat protein